MSSNRVSAMGVIGFRVNSMNGDANELVLDDKLVESNGAPGEDLSTKNSQNDRIKKKAKRPSNAVNAIGNAVNELNELNVNGHQVNGSIRNNIVNFKKLAKNSRRPRGRFGRGLPKKGGAGGKGTWGKPGIELVSVEEDVSDPHDPNYDSDSQDNCKFEAITPPLNENEVDKLVTPAINEYFENGDTEEVAITLEDMNLGDNHYLVLVIGVTLAMEKKASHREVTSVLISDLYGRVLNEDDIEKGFDVLLKSLPDLILDTPTAPTILGNFIARAIADDCIPPKYIQKYKVSTDCPHIKTAFEHADALLNMKHGLVRLDSVWGVCGGMRPVKYLVRQIQILLKEYVSSGDLDEATRCLQELEVPHFHHEFVYEAVLMVIEDMGNRTTDLICTLLKSLCTAAVVTVDQLKNGFNRVYEEMPDIVIDVPLAYQLLDKFVGKCAAQGFVPDELLKSAPTRGRKRFVSEGDGGLLKEDS